MVSIDSDFAEMAQLRRALPRVVWLRLGNRSTGEIEVALHTHRRAMDELEPSSDLKLS